MILADKIIRLRKKNGWSQEELAEKVQVSRQAVSKWEGAQTVPDLEKILALGRLFGVTTDYLLKDEIEDEEFTDDADRAPVKRVSLALANEFLEWRKRAAARIAAATLLCIVAVIPLLLLGAAVETTDLGVYDTFVAVAGLILLFLFVAVAVALFVSVGLQNAPFAFLDREPFETEYGVDGMVREKQKAYRPTYVRCDVVAACLCVLSPIPLFVSLVTKNEFLTVVLLTVTLLVAGVGAALFILSGVRWASMRKLLKEGAYALQDRKKRRIKDAVSTVYWLTATAVYLGWSFLTNDWKLTWVVWPIAGVLSAVVECLFNLFMDKENGTDEP